LDLISFIGISGQQDAVAAWDVASLSVDGALSAIREHSSTAIDDFLPACVRIRRRRTSLYGYGWRSHYDAASADAPANYLSPCLQCDTSWLTTDAENAGKNGGQA